jgi:ribosomal protein S18 acetylase RimI-like enzyme
MVALRAAVEAVDRAGSDVSEQGLEAQLSQPGHDPASDRFVLYGPDGTMAGYASAWLPPGSDAAMVGALVSPEARRKGLGRELLGRALDRARVLGARSAIAFSGEPGAAFAESLGFALAGSYGLYAADSPAIHASRLPEGWGVKAYSELGDAGLPLAVRAMNESYEGLWGHSEVSEADMRSWLASEFDPRGFLILFDGEGSLAGCCRAEMKPGREADGAALGYIDAPGLVARRREPGLYEAWLAEAVRRLRASGAERIELESWGDPPSTIALFLAAGFRKRSSYSEWRKAL